MRGDAVYRAKAELCRTLGHPARIRLLELLGAGERTVGELQEALELDSGWVSGGVSQHLTVLRRQGLLESTKVGTSVRCRLRDRRVLELLAIARELLTAKLEDSRLLLRELDVEATKLHGRPRREQA